MIKKEMILFVLLMTILGCATVEYTEAGTENAAEVGYIHFYMVYNRSEGFAPSVSLLDYEESATGIKRLGTVGTKSLQVKLKPGM